MNIKEDEDSANHVYKCDRCDFSTNDANIWNKNHKKSPVTFCCEKCVFKSCTFQGLEIHEKIKHSGNGSREAQNIQVQEKSPPEKITKLRKNFTITCDRCDFTTTDQTTMKTHNSKQSLVTFSCEICNYKSCTYQELESHEKSKHSVQNIQIREKSPPEKIITKLIKNVDITCDRCDFTTTNQNTMKTHNSKKSSVTFSCEICNYKSCTFQELEVHEKSKHSSQEHQGVEELEIPKSNTSNQFEEIVTNFDQNATNKESDPINMPQSDFQFEDVVTKFDMDVTSLTNIDISCDKCDFKSTDPNTMNAHKNDAALENDKSAQYNCGKSCGFKSCTINELKSHIEENHHHHGSPIQTENVKSVKKNSKYSGNFVTCDKCGFAMTNVGEILTHEKVCHKITSKTPTADLVCQKCDFTTTEEKSMIAHNNHPHYKCDKCDFSDVSDDEIERHKKNKAYYTQTKFKCTSCPFKFCTIFRLQYHEKSKHGKKAITPYFEKTQPVAVKFSCDKVIFLNFTFEYKGPKHLFH